jgi:hypothetical protein
VDRVAVTAALETYQPPVTSRTGWSGLGRREGLLALGLSAALVWLAQFHHFRDFGLYEDDYWFISEAMGKDISYLGARFVTAFTTLPQGRPFGFFLPDLLSFAGDKLGGLSGIYLLGFAIVTLNTFLCYCLLRTRVPVAPAAFGAAVFCLFPADTTKILLTHDFQLQPSLTFALLASLAYMSGRRPLAYVVSAGALLSYESGFLALFALPLFERPWDRHTWRDLARHVAIMLGIVLAVFALRFVVGERRAVGSAGSVAEIVPPLVGSLVLGPFRSLAGMFYGPLKAIPTWDTETLVAAAIGFVAFGVLLLRVRPRSPEAEPTAEHSPGTQPSLRLVQFQLCAAGVVMLVLGYALAFTHFPPNALVGRGTSVHLGATLGMSVVAAAVAWFLLSLQWQVAIALLSAYFAIAVGYYVTIEHDFMRSWQLQRAFWQQVDACCGDLQDGTVLLYTLTNADEPTFIFTNSWADPLILGETLQFPSIWTQPPRLFSVTDWQGRVQPDGDHLDWWVPAASWDEHWEQLPQGNVILLTRDADGNLVRVTGQVEVAGHELQLKAPGDPGQLPPAQLYAPLLGG